MTERVPVGKERSEEVKYILDSFKSTIGPDKLNELRHMFHKGLIQQVKRESKKEVSQPILFQDYLRSFEDYKAFNWLFKTKVTKEYLPELGQISVERQKQALKSKSNPADHVLFACLSDIQGREADKRRELY